MVLSCKKEETAIGEQLILLTEVGETKGCSSAHNYYDIHNQEIPTNPNEKSKVGLFL